MSHDDFSITVLRNKRIGDVPAVSRELLTLDRAPAVEVRVSQRSPGMLPASDD
jgi:hypothetical protein